MIQTGKYHDQVIHLISLPCAITQGDVQIANAKIKLGTKEKFFCNKIANDAIKIENIKELITCN